MDQIIQKQRSPYTGGTFNVQKLKSPNFGKVDGLNGMPFLVQLAQQVQQVQQVQQRPAVNSPPAHLWGGGGGGALPHERGQRSGTPRSYESEQQQQHKNNNNNNNNNPNHTCSNIGCTNNVCTHSNSKSCVKSLQFNGNYEGELPIPALTLAGSQTSSNPNLVSSEDFSSSLTPMRQLGRKTYANDTDSDSELCDQQRQYGGGVGGAGFGLGSGSGVGGGDAASSRWRSVFNYVKSGMPLQRQERMEAALQRCQRDSLLSRVLLLLQLLAILVGGAIVQGLRLAITVGEQNFGLWRCKFQMRSFLRHMLWRMANAKGNDLVIFLFIMLVTPWLFFISLLGLFVSLLFHLKEGLNVALLQLRLHVFN
ncbi:hypothetical protein KR222_000237 [Zaprionus bogoriensis]|nr:hypothetical protein KR222_000237 [Zaprionus bogoriensis]